jgi:tetratricopeptide (TPR) repeat protein
MKSVILSFLFFFLVIAPAKPQDNPVVDSLFEIVNQLWQSDIDSAIVLVEDTYRIGVETSDSAAIISALDYLGFCMDRKGQYEKGIEYYTRSADLKKRNGDSSLSWTYGEIGYCYMIMGEYEKATEYMQLGIDIAQKYGQKYDVGMGCNRLGVMHYRNGDLLNAMILFEKALQIGDSINALFITYEALDRLSEIQLYLKNNKRSLELAERALAVADSLDDKRQISSAYSRLGKIYMALGEFEKAALNYLTALEVSQSIDDLRGMQGCYSNLGDLSFKKKQYEEALKFFRSASNLEEGNKIMKSFIDRRIADIYYELGNIDSSLFYAQRAYNAGEALNVPMQMYKPAHLLYRIYKTRTLHSKALHYYEVYNKVKEIMFLAFFNLLF